MLPKSEAQVAPQDLSHEQDRVRRQATRRHHERLGKPFQAPEGFYTRSCFGGNQPLARNGRIDFPKRTRNAPCKTRRTFLTENIPNITELILPENGQIHAISFAGTPLTGQNLASYTVS